MNEETISRAVALLRFPLIMGVVCIHSDLRIACRETGMLPIFGPFINIFKADICFPVLDVFFFIAGFYFFKECYFHSSLYFNKLKKRFWSLFVPYMLWNGVTFVAICMCQAFSGSLPLLRKHILDFWWYDYLLIFWDKRLITGMPFDLHGPLMMQFWFVQCLMVAMVLSPVFWVGVRRVGWFFLLLLGFLLVIYPYRNYAGIRMDAFFFFAMGAYFQLHKKLWKMLQYPWVLTICWGVLWIAMYYVPVLNIVYCMVYVLLVLSLACCLYEAKRQSVIPPLRSSTVNLGKASFFIFAFHAFISQTFFNLWARFPFSWNDTLAFLAFFTTVIINVCLCFLVYSLMKKYTPKTLSLLMGGRVLPT